MLLSIWDMLLCMLMPHHIIVTHIFIDKHLLHSVILSSDLDIMVDDVVITRSYYYYTSINVCIYSYILVWVRKKAILLHGPTCNYFNR